MRRLKKWQQAPWRRKVPRNLLFVFICLVLSGCALDVLGKIVELGYEKITAKPPSKASDTLTRQSRTFVPPPGKANVYVIRSDNLLGYRFSSLWYVTLDYQRFGNLVPASYLYGVVDPGDHLVKFWTGQTSGQSKALEFNAVSGRNYFFKVSQGWSRQIAALDEEDGRTLIPDYTPSGDNSFDLLGSQAPTR
jgi:hypothetical protein